MATVATTMALTTLLLWPAAASAAATRRNVLFIGTDQQRTSTIKAYGNDWAVSPNMCARPLRPPACVRCLRCLRCLRLLSFVPRLTERPGAWLSDKLAAEGVRFTDCYTVSPVCSPSRTSVLTGVHVPIHGVYENGIGQYLLRSMCSLIG
eukprot:COSAG06_NODE_2658_length_6481_cov_157.286901_2_plen_150_part_00